MRTLKHWGEAGGDITQDFRTMSFTHFQCIQWG